MGRDNPVGVFDSGVGGVSVLHHIHELLPHEDLLYVADSGYAPYGKRSADFVLARALNISEFLLERQVKAIVVACNTATAAAVATLRARFSIPIIGMEPAVKPAATITQSGVVGVLATTGTLESDKFSALVEQHAQGAQVIVQCCVGLVEQVEKGLLDGPETRAMVAQYVEPLLAAGADTLVLGCTHYPFVAPVIRSVAGDSVTIIDTGPAVARQLRRRLEETEVLNPQTGPGRVYFWTTGDQAAVGAVISRLWGKTVSPQVIPN